MDKDEMKGLSSQAAKQDVEALERLRLKYRPVLDAMSQLHVQVLVMRVQDHKLYVQALAPSQEVKDRIWGRIKEISPRYADITAEITVLKPEAQNLEDPSRSFSPLPAAVESPGTAVTGNEGDTDDRTP